MMKAKMVVLAAAVMVCTMGTAQAQDATGFLMRVVAKAGANLVEKGVRSVVGAMQEATSGQQKPGEKAGEKGVSEGKEVAQSEHQTLTQPLKVSTEGSKAGMTVVVIDGVEMEVPTQLLALAGRGGDQAAAAAALKQSMAGAISTQAMADRAAMSKQQTHGIPLVGQVLAPMLVQVDASVSGLKGLARMVALASALSKGGTADAQTVLEAAALANKAASTVRAEIAKVSDEAAKAAAEQSKAEKQGEEAKPEASGEAGTADSKPKASAEDAGADGESYSEN